MGAVALLVLANQGNCDPTLKRQRRALQYPHNSCTGVCEEFIILGSAAVAKVLVYFTGACCHGDSPQPGA